MAYKRKSKYNRDNPKDLKKVKLYLKKIDELRINKGEDRTM